MTLPAGDHRYLDAVTPDQLAALLFELASQLHVERQRRMALEAALHGAGLIGPATLQAAESDPAFAEQGRTALDQSLRRLLRILTEAGDPTGPLRAEAPA